MNEHEIQTIATILGILLAGGGVVTWIWKVGAKIDAKIGRDEHDVSCRDLKHELNIRVDDVERHFDSKLDNLTQTVNSNEAKTSNFRHTALSEMNVLKLDSAVQKNSLANIENVVKRIEAKLDERYSRKRIAP